jgi:cytidine deaminase
MTAVEDLPESDRDLLGTAREATERAYVPYSEYQVGAALRTAEGAVFTGANLENANYSNSLHAEEVALSRARMAGHDAYEAVAVTSSERDGVTPCGMCRQTLAEFCGAEFRVLCDEGETVAAYTLGELLPAAMGPATLGK